jgi:hypothetical protein
MRLIEEQMWKAIECQDRVWTKDNTGVEYRANYDESLIYLHGHHIATYDHETEHARANVTTLRKWPTRTTMSRLRALGIDVYTRKGAVYLNDGLEIKLINP